MSRFVVFFVSQLKNTITGSLFYTTRHRTIESCNKASDARSRKYKVWDEHYDKIFNQSNLIESYLLSVLIQRIVNQQLLINYSNSDEDLTRYLSKNASLHLSRMSALLWHGSENWQDQNAVKRMLNEIVKTPSTLISYISTSFELLKKLIEGNPKFKLDLNSTLKSNELDNEISKRTHESLKNR